MATSEIRQKQMTFTQRFATFEYTNERYDVVNIRQQKEKTKAEAKQNAKLPYATINILTHKERKKKGIANSFSSTAAQEIETEDRET